MHADGSHRPGTVFSDHGDLENSPPSAMSPLSLACGYSRCRLTRFPWEEGGPALTHLPLSGAAADSAPARAAVHSVSEQALPVPDQPPRPSGHVPRPLESRLPANRAMGNRGQAGTVSADTGVPPTPWLVCFFAIQPFGGGEKIQATRSPSKRNDLEVKG